MSDIEAERYPSPTQAWYTVSVLFVAYVFAFVDRQILSLMVDPIKTDLGLSDTQISVLHGLAFAVFYTLCGIPIGRLVDRRARLPIVAAGVAFWSAMTALCGAARSVWSLFVCRVGVGIGEAALSPAAYSLIADSFPPRSRARAYAVYTLGVTVGSGVALILGGGLYDFFAERNAPTLPFGWTAEPWQLTFIAVGLPGLLVAALTLTLKEPARKDRLRDASAPSPTIRATLGFARSRLYLYASLFLGLSLLAMCSYAYVWLPAAFARDFGWSPGRYGAYAGLIFILCGSAGILVAGWLADRSSRQSNAATAAIRTLIVFSGFSVVFSATATLFPSPFVVLSLYAIATFFLMAPFGLAPTVIQAVTPNEYRGQISAVYLFCINILGLGLGPILVALLSRHLTGGEEHLRTAIALTCAICGPAGLAALLSVARIYKQAGQRIT